MCVTNDHEYVPCVVIIIRSFHHSWHHRASSNNTSTGATSGTGLVNPSGAPEFIPYFSGVRVTRSLVLCVLCVCLVDICLYLLYFFFRFIMLSVLRFTDSDSPFGILKLFLPFRSTIVFSGVVVRSFVFYVLYIINCPLSFSHCIVLLLTLQSFSFRSSIILLLPLITPLVSAYFSIFQLYSYTLQNWYSRTSIYLRGNRYIDLYTLLWCV